MKMVKLEELAKMIEEANVIKISDLEIKLGIPRTTLLRYLTELEKDGKIVKTFGEVKFQKKANVESYVMPRLSVNMVAKKAIAQEAFKLINDDEIIFLDGGTTTFYIAELLKDKNIKIYTNNLLITNLINGDYKPQVVLVPGIVNKNTLVTASSASIVFIKDIEFDKSFIGFNSYVSNSFSTTNESEAIFKRIVIEQTKPTNAFVVGQVEKSSERSKFLFALDTQVTLISSKGGK